MMKLIKTDKKYTDHVSPDERKGWIKEPVDYILYYYIKLLLLYYYYIIYIILFLYYYDILYSYL